MKNYNRKTYLFALLISIISAALLIIGLALYTIIGRSGLVSLLVCSVSASVCAVSGIVLLCIDLKSK